MFWGTADPHLLGSDTGQHAMGAGQPQGICSWVFLGNLVPGQVITEALGQLRAPGHPNTSGGDLWSRRAKDLVGF